ncbi:MAG TPA: hypothetical protein H9694_06015 [Firmicutes bacterium]|nr:hypothetical protein [Bacillota bacterium]
MSADSTTAANKKPYFIIPDFLFPVKFPAVEGRVKEKFGKMPPSLCFLYIHVVKYTDRDCRAPSLRQSYKKDELQPGGPASGQWMQRGLMGYLA